MNIENLKLELDQIKEEKYKLLKLVNHDIRSPFNRIYALLQLFEMNNSEISPSQNKYIELMYLSILSGLEMMQNLRDMREIDAGNITIDKAEYDLTQIVQSAIKSFYKQVEIKKIKIITELPNDKAIINSDEYFVKRVIENVLSNAIKFSKEGGEIIVRLNAIDTGYSIETQDFGCGIKPEEEHLLFQKYMKLSSIASGGEGSLGLGLHNTTYFLKRLNGSISLIRKKEIGSSFIINFMK